MSDKLGLYCGSFNPFHNGHYNIYRKAQKLFDKVILARGVNPDKEGFGYKEPNYPAGVEAISYYTLTTDLIKLYRTHDWKVTLVRGIRNGYDYDYEINQINVMRDFLPTLEVVLIPCDREFGHVSSSMIRALQTFNYHAADIYLPK